jgi:outer membrane immunogenic protein
MKKLLLGSATMLALALAAPAYAADLPAAPVYKAPAMAPAPIYDWTGFYIGLNGGYSFGRSASDFTTPVGTFSSTQDLNGWVFGGQIGYNWEFSHNWLFGLEADIQGTGQKGDVTVPGFTATVCPTVTIAALPCTTTTTGATFEQKLPWFGTFRGRLGFLPAPTWLLYLTGGLAFGEIESTGTVSTLTTIAFTGQPPISTTAASATASNNVTRAGWTVGAGTEWVISGPWTAKVEYLYVDFGTFNNSFAGLGAFAPIAISSRVTDNIVRLGINYRFGGPVVARY